MILHFAVLSEKQLACDQLAHNVDELLHCISSILSDVACANKSYIVYIGNASLRRQLQQQVIDVNVVQLRSKNAALWDSIRH